MLDHLAHLLNCHNLVHQDSSIEDQLVRLNLIGLKGFGVLGEATINDGTGGLLETGLPMLYRGWQCVPVGAVLAGGNVVCEGGDGITGYTLLGCYGGNGLPVCETGHDSLLDCWGQPLAGVDAVRHDGHYRHAGSFGNVELA